MVEAVVPSDGDFVLMVAICLVIVMIPYSCGHWWFWVCVSIKACIDGGGGKGHGGGGWVKLMEALE